MAQALTAAMPPFLDIKDGYIVRFTAVSPADGSTVSGVVISDATVQAEVVTQTTDTTAVYQLEHIYEMPGPSS